MGESDDEEDLEFTFQKASSDRPTPNVDTRDLEDPSSPIWTDYDFSAGDVPESIQGYDRSKAKSVGVFLAIVLVLTLAFVIVFTVFGLPALDVSVEPIEWYNTLVDSISERIIGRLQEVFTP